jgi:hypothetical protein
MLLDRSPQQGSQRIAEAVATAHFHAAQNSSNEEENVLRRWQRKSTPLKVDL